MGNIKSKKVKITQCESPQPDHDNHERINTLKTDVSDVTAKKNENSDKELDQIEEKQPDNASSASTVEVLDDKNAAARSKSSKMPNPPIKFYYYPVSPPCRAVQMTANVLGLQMEMMLINIMEGEQKKPEFLKINPQHTVPTIDDGGFILWESRAIMAYLVNAYGRNDSLYPKNNRQRATVDQCLYYDISLYQKFTNLYWPVVFFGKEYSEENAAKLNEALGWLNSMLEGRSFVAGDNLSIADISIVVTMSNLEAFGFDYNTHGNVVKWFEQMKKELDPFGYKEIDKKGAEDLAKALKKD